MRCYIFLPFRETRVIKIPLKGKSASVENIHMRDILIFPVVSFVNFFSDIFLPNKY